MGTSHTSRQPVSLLVEVTRSADGRPEGSIRTAPADPGQEFSGVLELLKVLEDHLDRNDSDPARTPTSDVRDTHPGPLGHSQNEAAS
jgi:hypothetical protein